MSELKNNLRIRIEKTLKDMHRLVSFDEMMDTFLEGLGRKLVREMISSDLASELYGLSALEKFNTIIKK